jgi:hypothetical protein
MLEYEIEKVRCRLQRQWEIKIASSTGLNRSKLTLPDENRLGARISTSEHHEHELDATYHNNCYNFIQTDRTIYEQHITISVPLS